MKGYYCVLCGGKLANPREINAADTPLNDDEQAWQFLCDECWKVVYGEND